MTELQRSDREVRDFIEHAPVAMHGTTRDGTILWANEAELKLLGYKREEYIGHRVTEFHLDQPVVGEILRRMQSDETLNGYEARLRCRDGSIRYVSMTSSIYSEDGRFAHIRCVSLDVTVKKEAAELQVHLAAIVESSDDAIISKNLDGIILSWNRGAERVFGYKAEEVIGKHVSMLAAPDCIDEIPAILERISRGEIINHYETRRKTKDGRILTVSLTISPIRDADGRIIAASKVARDVTVQKRASELQERLATIIESSDDAIISKDLNGFIRSWNGGAERLFGYTAGEAIGKHITIVIPPDRLGEEPEILGRLQRGERVHHFETIRRHKDGALLDISLTISPVKDSQGKVVGASKVARDITQRKRQEQALAAADAALMRSNTDLQSAYRFQLVVESAPNAMIMVGADGLVTLVNTQTEKLFGYTRHELLGRSIDILLPERFRPDHGAHRHAFFAAPGARAMGEGRDLFGLRKDGSEVPVEIGLNPISTADGQFVLASIIDITERRQQQEEIRAQEANFRFLAESVPQIVWTSRPDGWIDYYNHRWFAYTGLTQEQTQGGGWESVVHPDDLHTCIQAWRRAIQSGDDYQVECRFKRSGDGAYRWHLGRALPRRDEQGQVLKWFGTFTDVDDYKEGEAKNISLREELEDRVRLRTADLERSNERLRKSSNKLEESNRELQDFASVASHDLQEPLRKVRAFGDRLKTL